MKVFISYAHKDDEYRQELQAHLKSLKLTHHLKVWDDSELFPGDNWEEEVRMNIRSADILLFLISSDFMNSNYIWEEELPMAIERNIRGDAIVIPIFVRPCETTGLAINQLQGLPKSGKPVSSYKNRDEAYVEIVTGIRKRLSEMPKW